MTNAPEGRRRTTLYGAARGIARMVAAGAITPADAYTALYDAGVKAHQTDRDIRAWCRMRGHEVAGIAAADDGTPAYTVRRLH